MEIKLPEVYSRIINNKTIKFYDYNKLLLAQVLDNDRIYYYISTTNSWTILNFEKIDIFENFNNSDQIFNRKLILESEDIIIKLHQKELTNTDILIIKLNNQLETLENEYENMLVTPYKNIHFTFNKKFADLLKECFVEFQQILNSSKQQQDKLFTKIINTVSPTNYLQTSIKTFNKCLISNSPVHLKDKLWLYNSTSKQVSHFIYMKGIYEDLIIPCNYRIMLYYLPTDYVEEFKIVNIQFNKDWQFEFDPNIKISYYYYFEFINWPFDKEQTTSENLKNYFQLILKT